MNLSYKEGLIKIFPKKKARGAEKERALYKLFEYIGKLNQIGERIGTLKPQEIRDSIAQHKKKGFSEGAVEFLRKVENDRAGVARRGKARKAAVARWRKKRIKKR